LIVSNGVINSRLNTLVVVPLSTRAGEIWPLRVKVAAGSRKPSFAVIPGIRQVAKTRLLDAIATLSARDLAVLERAVQAYLSD
jgi:mRNA-degrading endonuclease toxin of MazEF toxin-antitoxin module